MEATIASLEAKLAAAQREKEEAISRNENLASELEIISRKLNVSNSSLKELQENIYGLVNFFLPLFMFLAFSAFVYGSAICLQVF